VSKRWKKLGLGRQIQNGYKQRASIKAWKSRKDRVLEPSELTEIILHD
jgi:hypothetical protein